MAAQTPPALRLAVTAGNAHGMEIRVEDELLIGRAAPGAGKLAEDSEISREHARITRTPEGSYVIEDLESTNGTFVNTRRIQRPESLMVGDRVEVGATTLVVQFSASTPSPEPAQTEAPEPAPPPADEEVPPRVSLRVEIDMEAGEARIELEDGSDVVRLVHEDGRWKIAPAG